MDRSTDDPTYTWNHFLRRRGVHTPCEKCGGLGVYHYSHGSTWRGGVGPCCFQWDICDQCWSTGDKHRIGTDIRKLEEQRKNWEESQVLEYLARRLGCGLSGISKRILALAELCEKQANRRKLPEGEQAFWWHSEWHMLSEILKNLANKS